MPCSCNRDNVVPRLSSGCEATNEISTYLSSKTIYWRSFGRVLRLRSAPVPRLDMLMFVCSVLRSPTVPALSIARYPRLAGSYQALPLARTCKVRATRLKSGKGLLLSFRVQARRCCALGVQPVMWSVCPALREPLAELSHALQWRYSESRMAIGAMCDRHSTRRRTKTGCEIARSDGRF
jgi:hypothetical protein